MKRTRPALAITAALALATLHAPPARGDDVAPASTDEVAPARAAGGDNLVDVLFGPSPAASFGEGLARVFELRAELLSMLVYRNDSDFDRGRPAYDHGQDVGFLGTFFKPQLTVKVADFLRLYWETEIGLDIWSRNDPDVGLGSSGDRWAALGFKQRELWGEARWGDGWSLRVGYQRVVDVSGLFVNHWIGALSIGYGDDRTTGLRVFGGQIPDQTYEGWNFAENNFTNDVFVAGLDGRYVLAPWAKLVAGVYWLGDGSRVGHRRDVGVLEAGVAFAGEGFAEWDASLSLVGQLGAREAAGADGSHTGVAAWGLSANGGLRIPGFSFRASATVLSADDASDGNDSRAFLWSGKRPGLSLLLSENETRDIGGNLDERVASDDGALWETRAGLAGVDVSLFGYPIPELALGLTSAVLLVLAPDNALGGRQQRRRLVGGLVVDLEEARAREQAAHRRGHPSAGQIDGRQVDAQPADGPLVP